MGSWLHLQPNIWLNHLPLQQLRRCNTYSYVIDGSINIAHTDFGGRASGATTLLAVFSEIALATAPTLLALSVVASTVLPSLPI